MRKNKFIYLMLAVLLAISSVLGFFGCAKNLMQKKPKNTS